MTGSVNLDQRAYLKWQEGKLPLTTSCLIGRRTDNDLSINDDEISRRHALLTKVNEEWWITDLDSRNGVIVNRLKLKAARRLRSGDQIFLGRHCLTFYNGITEGGASAIGGNTTKVALAEDGTAAPRQALLIASSDGLIMEGEKAAHRFFGSLKRTPGAKHYHLPLPVRQWLERMSSPEATYVPLEIHEGDMRIVISLKKRVEDRFFITLLENSEQDSVKRIHGLSGLTGRQAQVMYWVAEGRTNPEIAMILGVAVHTVNRHLEHIFCKLGVQNRAQAVTMLRERLAEP